MEVNNSITIYAKYCFVVDAWQKNVRVTATDGRISQVEIATSPRATDYKVGILLPAMANVHSHCFQRFIAGLTEYQSLKGRDNFWSWREAMYRYANQINPDHLYHIAALAYMEMLEAGFAAVAEFHYIHHQSNGKPYDNPIENSCSIFAAAKVCGIGLTHLPVFYRYSSLNNQPLQDHQKCFGNNLEQFVELYYKAEQAVVGVAADANIGIAPHSLRAVSATDLHDLTQLLPDIPKHIHISEQQSEVAEVLQHYKCSPIEWLLNNIVVDKNWCLVHATHCKTEELKAIAQSQAIVGLCPITEANLGDGIFPAQDFLQCNGQWGIGTDSNVLISLAEELRLLEYGQRLQLRRRNILSNREQNIGLSLYRNALNGYKALQRPSGSISIGLYADLIALDDTHPNLTHLTPEQFFDGFIFTTTTNPINDVWSYGRHVVKEGVHINREAIVKNYQNLDIT